MGNSLTILCQTCDYRQDFTMGVGMMYSPERVLDFASEEWF